MDAGWPVREALQCLVQREKGTFATDSACPPSGGCRVAGLRGAAKSLVQGKKGTHVTDPACLPHDGCRVAGQRGLAMSSSKRKGTLATDPACPPPGGNRVAGQRGAVKVEARWLVREVNVWVNLARWSGSLDNNVFLPGKYGSPVSKPVSMTEQSVCKYFTLDSACPPCGGYKVTGQRGAAKSLVQGKMWVGSDMIRQCI
nr:hypothetical protein Iba_chr12dCG14530 [Ipomoea batatas]